MIAQSHDRFEFRLPPPRLDISSIDSELLFDLDKPVRWSSACHVLAARSIHLVFPATLRRRCSRAALFEVSSDAEINVLNTECKAKSLRTILLGYNAYLLWRFQAADVEISLEAIV